MFINTNIKRINYLTKNYNIYKHGKPNKCDLD